MPLSPVTGLDIIRNARQDTPMIEMSLKANPARRRENIEES